MAPDRRRPPSATLPGVPAGTSADDGAAWIQPGLPPDLVERAREAAAILGRDLRTLPPRPAADPWAAELVPADLTDPPVALHPVPVRSFRKRSGVRRALAELGVDDGEAAIAMGVGGTGATTLALTLYRVPGVDARRLGETFETVIAKPSRARWSRRTVGDRDVRWVDTPEFTNAFWARDGLVVHVGGDPAEIIRVIGLLP